MREHHRSPTEVIFPSNCGKVWYLLDGQLSVGEQHSAPEKALHRVCKDNAHLSTGAFKRTLMFFSIADCAELSWGWLKQVRQSPKTHMALLVWCRLCAKLSQYRALISNLIRRCCHFAKLLNPNRMLSVDGVIAVRGSVGWASIQAGEREIHAPRFRLRCSVYDRAHYRFVLLKHMGKVIGLLSSHRLITYTSICSVASLTLAAHGPAQ